MDKRWRGLLAAAATMGLSAPAMAQQAQVPEAIKARVNELVAACAKAGGTLGNMTGQGQFVIPADLTGDGRTDFVISEGNFPCAGKPNLFRGDGLGRVQVYAGDGAGGARLLFDERLLAYRLVAGKPTKLQIARRGTACGSGVAASARCGDELRWNAAATRFDAVATDGRPTAPRPVTAPEAGTAVAAGAAAAPAGATATLGPVPPVLATAQTTFKAECRKRYLADKPQKTDWIDGACADDWKRVADTQPVLEKLLQAGPGTAPTLAEVKQRMTGVRWAPRTNQGSLADGQFGGYGISISGKARPEGVNVNWMKEGAMIPLDVPSALAARGAKVTLVRCEKTGTGEGERAWSVAFPGQPAFGLEVYERTAPTASAFSSYSATLRLDGVAPQRGATNCEQFW